MKIAMNDERLRYCGRIDWSNPDWLTIPVESVSGTEHEVLLFKRQDACHEFALLRLELAEDGELLELPPRSERRIEVYGDRICFEVTASCIAVQYRKTVAHPALRARMILDGQVETARILDGNFEENWGDCLYLEPVLHHGESKKHRLELEILPEDEKKMGIREWAPFYLMALIIA